MSRRQDKAWKKRRMRAALMLALMGMLAVAAFVSERNRERERSGEIVEHIETINVETEWNTFELEQDYDENGTVYDGDEDIETFNGNAYTSAEASDIWETDASFEETGEEITAYEEFLEGTRTAVISGQIYDGISYFRPKLIDNPTEEFYIWELVEQIVDEVTCDGWADSIESIQYALISCESGKRMLAVRAYGLSIYSPYDDSYLTMVFNYSDGTLFMIYAEDSWARSYSMLYQNGYVSGGGSGGATHHFIWEGIIGEDGLYHVVYELTMDSGIWDSESGETINGVFTDYTFNGETIYAYYLYDDATEQQEQKARAYLEQRVGSVYYTDDEAWAMVEEYRSSFGVTDEMRDGAQYVVWQTLSLEPAILQREIKPDED